MGNSEGYLEHILKLLKEKDIPQLPAEYAENPLIVQIHEDIKAIREILSAFSSGDFSPEITVKGIIPDCINSLQANLRHLIRQVQTADIDNNMRKEVEHIEIIRKSEAHLKFLASHDPLTGILNRRSFIEMIEIELSNAANNNVPCCLAMMDIDNFNDFNETYGHVAGDKAIYHVAKTIESKLRKNDFMGRYGGEEFIIYFYDTEKEKALKALERLRTCLSESPVPLENGSVAIYASFGLVENDTLKTIDKENIQKLINAADAALHAAKSTGRNKVTIFSSEMDLGHNKF